MPQHAPWQTCEPVLTEAAHLSGAPDKILKLVARGDLLVSFDLAAESDHLLDLVVKYRERGMDVADACLVRMAELDDGAQLMFSLGGGIHKSVKALGQD